MRFLETVMGIPMSVDIRNESDEVADEAAAAAFEVLRDADRRFSRYRQDSELQAVNGGRLEEAGYSDDLREVLRIGRAAADASGGAFTLRASDGSLDTDGVVKGWAAARAARALDGHGIRNFCLNAGGDVVVAGSPDGHAAWNVGVRSVDDAQTMMAVLAVTDCAVATSAAYERGDHIVDGRTGRAASGLRSVTVVAPDLTTADVLATSVFALGEDGVDWALGHGALGVIAIADDGRLLAAGALPLAVAS
ncbi:FAD:protein FMN transferase [Leifsonia sp. NPDC058248]|uniref:FAD:protein FMN transferase n=1 Tax=Leifsonia sp. NPDC058248 TaxID=3346402 RepID=UPI0036DD9A5C